MEGEPTGLQPVTPSSSMVSRMIRIPDFVSSGDKSWKKTVLIIVGTTTVVVVGGCFLFRVFRRIKSSSSGSVVSKKCLQRNGSLSRSGYIPKNQRNNSKGVAVPQTPVESRARLEMEQEMEGSNRRESRGLPLFMESPLNGDSNHRPSSSWAKRRLRSDSLTSGTTLLITSRSPYELMLYGLESLKRSIRLFEETQTKMTLEVEDFGSVSRENSPDGELEFILCKSRQLADDIDSYLKEHFPDDVQDGSFSVTLTAPSQGKQDKTANEFNSNEDDAEDNDIDRDHSTSFSLLRQRNDPQFGSNYSLATTLTLPFFDIEPNLHFFKLYTLALDSLEDILPPRSDRTNQLKCETHEEYLAKVHCLRQAFSELLREEENAEFFRSIGQDILEIVLSHSLKDPSQCLEAFDEMIDFVSNSENHGCITQEISHRNIPLVSFYDLVLDYMILESFDDLDSPPSAVTSVANNRWLSAGFRELALQTAVSAVLKHKRSKLSVKEGFFEHFYNILEHVSPVLAWGFLGSDGDLKFKCNLIKDSILSLSRGYFSFDRVRYTSINDLKEDILRITDDEYDLLRRLLSASDESK